MFSDKKITELINSSFYLLIFEIIIKSNGITANWYSDFETKAYNINKYRQCKRLIKNKINK